MPIVIYQGGFRPHRGIEQIVAALLEPELRDAVGVFLGYGPQRDWISAQAARPDLAGRLFVVDAVPPDVLLEWTASAGVTLSPLRRRCRTAALDRYNWETEAGHLLATYAVLVGTPEAGA